MDVKEIINLQLDVSSQRITTVPPDPYGFIFEFFRGNTLQWNVLFVDEEGVEIDLSSVEKVSLELKDIRKKLIPDPYDPLALYTETDTVDQPTVLESPASQNGIYSGVYWCTISLYGEDDQLFTAVSGRVFVRETGQGNNLPPPVVEDLRDEARDAAERAENAADRAEEAAEEVKLDLEGKADLDGGNLEQGDIDAWKAMLGVAGKVAVPENQDSPGSPGQWAADGPVLYWCVDTDKWIQIYGADTFQN